MLCSEDGFDDAFEATRSESEGILRSRNEVPGLGTGQVILALKICEGDIDIPHSHLRRYMTEKLHERGEAYPQSKHLCRVCVPQLVWNDSDRQIRGDAATDGCYPLITSGRDFTGLYVVEAYHGQPHLERRHHILEGVQDAAPVRVNNIDRIDAVFCCHFIAQVIGALIERQIRNAMAAADIAKIPIYPELRGCAAPSADKVLQIFAGVTRHELHDQHGNLVQTFEPQLTALQRQVLELLEVPGTAFTATAG